MNEKKSHTEPPHIIDAPDLFDNPMVRAADAAMSDEEKEHYRRIGEEMYGPLDFETSNVLNNMPEPMTEAVAYVEIQIRSGLHPSMMEDNEKMLLEEAYGKNWYTKWGFVEQDLTEIYTVKPYVEPYVEPSVEPSVEP